MAAHSEIFDSGLDRRRFLRRVGAALALAAFFAAFANVVQTQTVATGLWLSAAGLALWAFSVWGWRIREVKQTPRVDGIMGNVIKHDPALALLTNADGFIHDLNKGAAQRLSSSVGDNLVDGFAAVLANPEAVLFRLVKQAQETGGSSEEVTTRAGRFRISITRLAPNRLLWRVDGDAAVEQQPVGSASSGPPLPMLTVATTGTVLFVNDACRQLLGRRPKSIEDVFGKVPLRSGLHRALMTPDGVKHVVLAVIESVAARKEIFLIPTVEGAETAPRELKTDWDAIEDLPVPLMKISADGEIQSSNREARNLLDLSSTDGKKLAEIMDGLGRPISDWIKEAIEGRGGFASQFLRGRGDCANTYVQVTLNIAGGADDAHLIAVLNDVTELKTLEAQFVQSQKMQAIGQLAGGVAHDFNNLLTAISGHCDLLLLRHDHGDQNYGDLIQIHQNANRAASLVGQLLAFSRKQNLQLEILDLRETLSDLTHLLNRLVGEKVSLVFSHEVDLDPIKADKRQLEQVLMNLVVNARDAMPDGGEVDITTKNVRLISPMSQDRAEVPPGEYVVVTVKDEGHGIPPERLPKIFDPFETSKRTGEGTGLGLSTVYGIVKQTGGFVFATSEVDVGTTFTLWFPVQRSPIPEAKPEREPLPHIDGTVDGGVVLLVEDEAPVRAFASRALRLGGHTVLEADCAEAALELLSDPELNVDVFVTDVIMPGMNGPTWVRQALEHRPDTRVVFVSGYAEDAFGDEGSEVSNAVFLPKPFSLNDLTKTVQSQLLADV